MKLKNTIAGLLIGATLAVGAVPTALAADVKNSPASTVTAPKPVEKVNASSTQKGTVTVTFAKSTTKKVAGYQIRIYNKNGKLVDTIYSTDGKATIKGRKSGASYTVKVRSYKKSASGKKVYSSSKSKKIKVK